jgi:hypothetical protein
MIVSMTFCSCGQTKTIDNSNGFSIDPNIKKEAEKYISKSELSDIKGKMKGMIYNNRILADFYKNDKLEVSTKDSTAINSIFKSFYYWQHDTLGIDGAFGLFEGIGFSIKICNGKATLYHMVASNNNPGYAYKEKDSLIYRLEIPCTDTKIVLSEIPDSTKKQIIYGYVEFKSGEYYESIGSGSIGSGEWKEFLPRNKNRANMKIYFRSMALPF